MVRLSAHERVTVAMITGIAENYSYLRRSTHAQAVDAIRTRLDTRGVPAERRSAVLAAAAAGYTSANPEPRPGHPEALAVMVELGADPAEAEQVWHDVHRKGSGAWRV